MQIKQAEFIKSVAGVNDLYESELAEIAVVGRSNVGKSSLINAITNNGKLARVSNTPGRTRLINYFLVTVKAPVSVGAPTSLRGGFADKTTNQSNNKPACKFPSKIEGCCDSSGMCDGAFLLVDLPGYGYAKASKQQQAKWGELIEGYLKASKNLKAVYLLLDIRNEPTVQDRQMLSFLVFYNIPVIFVATKADKLSKMQAQNQLNKLAAALKITKNNIILTSSTKKAGVEELISSMEQRLQV